MSWHDWLRLTVILATCVGAAVAGLLVWHWHATPNHFDLRDLFMTVGKDKKPHVSRVALAELVALAATTSAYLGAMAVKPETFTEATACYGGLWAVRGGFATWIKNRK